jgi:hypothetical protein
LKAVASRAISSEPLTSIGLSSSVRATSSAADVRRRTGRSPDRATPMPNAAATTTPSPPTISMTTPSLPSVLSVVSSDCASASAVPGSVGTVTTR